MIKRRERHIDRLNSREDTWKCTRIEDTWKCTRIEDTLKSRDICIFTLVVVFRRLWYLSRDTWRKDAKIQTLSSQKISNWFFYDKLYIFSSFQWTRNLHGLQPLNPKCTSFSPDGLDNEPQPPFKMFRCDNEIFPLTLPYQRHPKPPRYKWRTP